MSVARIICTVFEDALQLAGPLSLGFDVVEIVEPGVACGPADLEINLQWCSLDEALASVSLLVGTGAAFQNQGRWSSLKASETKGAAEWASNISHHAHRSQEHHPRARWNAQSANWAGNGIAAAAQHRKIPATASATTPPAVFIKAPGRGSRFVDWLHRFCPITRGQFLP